jgi:hypothetical protein
MYANYLHLLTNKNEIVNYLYNMNDYEFLIDNKYLFEVLCDNCNKYNKFARYLLDIQYYNIIYNNENLNNFIKDYYKIIIMNINDINNDYNEDDLKNSIEDRFIGYQIIWI